MNDRSQSFYCNQKFKWLTVNLEKLQTFSCCSATPHTPNMQWLDQHPGHLFNTPELQAERNAMLQGQPVASCEASCWRAESQGLPSRRTILLGDAVTHTNVQADPEILHIIVGSDCNMTCAYCCKFYSTAWTRDILSKTYPVDDISDRFTINNTDRVLVKISQKEIQNLERRKLLIQEVRRLYQSPALKQIFVTGGEPFLYLDLENLLSEMPTNIEIKIVTGLGVSESRFQRIVERLPSNVTVMVSGESVNDYYEFIRYGNTWSRFINNLNTLKQSNLHIEFSSTISNLTVFGLVDFAEFLGDIPATYLHCNDPDFLSVHVLDPESKQHVLKQADLLPKSVVDAIAETPTQMQVDNFKKYINEFAARRNLKFDMFPNSLVSWIKQ